MRGEIDYAITMTAKVYPSLLESDKLINFQLRCRKFVEMICNSSSTMETGSGSEFCDDLGSLQEALQFGQRLQDDYRDDTRPEIQEKLVVGLQCAVWYDRNLTKKFV
jgi:hypothetical protein